MLLHATAVARHGRCVLLRGPSGAGKSDLALRLIASPASPALPTGDFALLSDDQVRLEAVAGALQASAPASIAGRMEVRGIGIVEVPATNRARVVLVADLVPPDGIERMPETASISLLGIAVSRVAIAPFESSAPLKLALALDGAVRRLERP
jgi:serine kinase of HPr protein (carbohydrate metabolism regulator)